MLLIGMAILLNILIAIFGKIYSKVQQKSDEEWKNEVFTLLRDFQHRSILPHPLCILHSVYYIIVWYRDYVTPTRNDTQSPKFSVCESPVEVSRFEQMVVQIMLRGKNSKRSKENLASHSLKIKNQICERLENLNILYCEVGDFYTH